ncbi:DUF3318 domain-containing protein [Trichothermofontia sichuanensis B231]|uniref:DUF3318 domain-containing protein n=1 Tax=Trichothermofontia sichuanensis TaxID=3045816 RepID=UPI002247A32B|nr:DUF3318 domain-containing protein [Trichothermofontia sichuanensis]UZQ56157.1 DUF3318 domain-containing protein [Trichothermofontia sichuanensis B231]
MNPDTEIARLRDLMPASGRMHAKLVSRPEQRSVLEVQLPPPWRQTRLISINFDLWGRLPRPQRDLLLLRAVAWTLGVRWFKLDLYQGPILAGLVGAVVELSQGDAVGTLMAGGLSTIGVVQLWRSQTQTQRELEADEAALQTAQRRGYTEADAARHLLEGIAAIADLENRTTLSFVELLRSQNLRAIAGLSAVTVPEALR